MLCSMLPGPGSWLAGSSAAPQSVLPWPPQLGDPGAATRDEAAQITALPAARAGCELRSRPRSHTRPQSTATGRGAAGSPGRAQARTRTEAPSPAGKPISTPSLPRGTRRPNPWSRLQHTLTPPPHLHGHTPPFRLQPERPGVHTVSSLCLLPNFVRFPFRKTSCIHPVRLVRLPWTFRL